jgi:hypothetical protein
MGAGAPFENDLDGGVENGSDGYDETVGGAAFASVDAFPGEGARKGSLASFRGVGSGGTLSLGGRAVRSGLFPGLVFRPFGVANFYMCHTK